MNTIGSLNIPTTTYSEVSNWRIVDIEYEGGTMSRIQIQIVDRHESINWYLAEAIWKENYMKMREHCKVMQIDIHKFNKLRGFKVGKYKQIYNEKKNGRIADIENKMSDISIDDYWDEIAQVRRE
jgi:hypothetical protein